VVVTKFAPSTTSSHILPQFKGIAMSSKNIYCVYLTTYRGNKLPPFYIGKTNVYKIEHGYRGSVSSNQYKSIWLSELKTHLFKTIILKRFDNKYESSEYEIKLLRHFNAHKNPMYINLCIGGISFNLDESLQNKTHHFNSSEFQKKNNETRLKSGKHQFLDHSFQREMSLRAKKKKVIMKISQQWHPKLIANC
jgi:hypothetical protein